MRKGNSGDPTTRLSHRNDLAGAGIVSTTADDDVPSGATADRVITAEAEHHVVAAERGDHVVT